MRPNISFGLQHFKASAFGQEITLWGPCKLPDYSGIQSADNLGLSSLCALGIWQFGANSQFLMMNINAKSLTSLWKRDLNHYID